jgi:hypothetical protein
MTARRKSVRKRPPDPTVFEYRKLWGARLLAELRARKKTPEWLGREIGYRVPGSMRQVINGHQGISKEQYEKVLRVIPEMAAVLAPPMRAIRKGRGSPGPHKKHAYPKLGPIVPR